jgi:hypothetical protein
LSRETLRVLAEPLLVEVQGGRMASAHNCNSTDPSWDFC